MSGSGLYCPNKRLKGTRDKAARPFAERVCQAWHRTSGVEVPVPGIREAEG